MARFGAAFACVLVLLLAAQPSSGAELRAFKDLTYARVNGKPIGLDLYLPVGVQNPSLLVYLHGGAWANNNKSQYPGFLVDRGFAVASLDFRSTNEARFPANVYDIKAGIRFLRAKAAEYGYRSERIAVVGASSGGHLAVLVGVTNGNKALEGAEGEYLDQSSAVQAVVSYFGATNLTTILSQSTPAGLVMRAPALEKLFGAPPDKAPELARLASPVFHVDRDDPPVLLLHGDQDTQMPINQVHELQGAYENVGREVDVMILHGVDHVAPPFFSGKPVDRVVEFLRRTLN